jgi:ElaB/YqjD/DUF883 family membrane-anchored ribosome-binding protein
MKLNLYLLITVLWVSLLPADGQAVRLPDLSTVQAKPLLLDTLTKTIKRSEYLQLELARKTLLELSFTDTDQVITTQQKVITECEQALQQVVSQSSKTIKSLQDTLSQTRQLIIRSSTTNERVTTTVSQTSVRLNNFSSIIKDAKRFVWVQRLTSFGIGVAVGVVLPPAINLLSKLF